MAGGTSKPIAEAELGTHMSATIDTDGQVLQSLAGLRVITNHSGAVPYFRGLMQQHGICGSVAVRWEQVGDVPRRH